MSNFDRERAEKSLVTVYQTDDGTGMGVLTCNDLILTAAHCLPRMPDLDDPHFDRVRVKFRPFSGNDQGVALVVGADACLDLAILSDRTVMNGSFEGNEGQDFRTCLAQLDPAELLLQDLPINTAIPIHILSHKKVWISGEAIVYSSEDRFLDVTPDEQSDLIEPGTSGAPVFDNNGRVIGIVSSSSDLDGADRSATAAWLPMALPGWFLKLAGHELK